MQCVGYYEDEASLNFKKVKCARKMREFLKNERPAMFNYAIVYKLDIIILSLMPADFTAGYQLSKIAMNFVIIPS